MADDVKKRVIFPQARLRPELEPESFPKGRRSEQELEPIAGQVAENAPLMERLRAAIGSQNQALGTAVMDEVRNYAKGLDPTINYSEGTKIVTILLKKVGHFR